MKRVAVAIALGVLPFSQAWAGGFEIPENTTRAVARGGTGVASKRDPSAIYFNPALLSRSRGLQVLLDVNLVDLSLDFQRAPLEVGSTRREFDPIENTAGFFPAPFLAVSYDFGVEGLGVGVGVFGPSAYGKRCFGDAENDCAADDRNGARLMMLESDLLQVYFTAGASYEFALGSSGSLAVGLAGSLAWQKTSFTVEIDELLVSPPFDEDPTNQAPLRAENLQDFQPTGFVGLAYFNGPVTVGASYRPPLSWSDEGDMYIDLPEGLQDLARLEGSDMTFETNQAGSLRAGVDYAIGTHPGDPTAPLFDVEFNFVWEDWSRVDYFKIAPDARFFVADVEQPLNDVYQPKNWQDTFSLRLGGSYAALPWLTAHAGGSYETAAQDLNATNTDFVSWERIGAGAGVTIHATPWVDVDLGYAYTYSGSRTVTDGEVYQQIPMSGCVGPDFDADACAVKGTPPGNPQNNGEWEAAFQIISAGATFKFDP